MHPKILEVVVGQCRLRHIGGDCPAIQAPPEETMEFAIIDQADAIAAKDAEIERLTKALTKIVARNQVKRNVIINDQGMHINQVRFFDGEFALIARAALSPKEQPK